MPHQWAGYTFAVCEYEILIGIEYLVLGIEALVGIEY